MKYMGSKNRIAKEILSIILKDRKPNQWYIEPFVGGANMIDKVDGLRMGSDVNEYLIALLIQLQHQVPFDPPHIGEVEYRNIQQNKSDYPKWLVGYVGFNLSFAAKFFGWYRRDRAGIRDYENEAQQNLLAQVSFFCSTYDDLYIPPCSLIYCDPPYANTTNYRDKFDHNKFWQWVRSKIEEGHRVFISEYSAPDDFVSVWQKEVNNSLTKNTGLKKGVEHLFIHKSQYIQPVQPKNLFSL